MQQDDIVWNILGESFCSFRIKGPYDGYQDNTNSEKYCKHPYNLTGKCKFEYCPLANSKYCTVVNEEKKVFLMTKTPERVHFPNKAWEKTELPSTRDFETADAELERRIMYFPDSMKDAAHMRLRLIDKLIRRTDSLNATNSEEYIAVKTKENKREKNRERHAVKSANLEANIEKEIFERAMEGVFGEHEILNLEKEVFEQKMKALQEKGEQESLNESMDSELSGDVALGLDDDIEDVGELLKGEKKKEKKVKSKTRIATRLKMLKTMSSRLKRKKMYELETENENQSQTVNKKIKEQ